MSQTIIQTGPQLNGDAQATIVRGGRQGDMIVTELHGSAYESSSRGNTFITTIPATFAANVAYGGAAAGTPLLAVYNPKTNTKNLSLIAGSWANFAAPTAAANAFFAAYFGPSTTPITAAANGSAINLLTGAASSQAQVYVNTALTGSSAASGFIPMGSYYWATAAGATISGEANPTDFKGLVVPPGGYVAIGASTAVTGATWAVSLIWEEIPV